MRQLCWRDFHHQVLAAYPPCPSRDYRPRGDRWSRSERALDAWRQGLTGYPARRRGDAPARRRGLHAQPRPDGRRLLPDQGPLHRLAPGARHFWDLLSDGEVANNAGNWQWVAGTGNDSRPNRVLNPIRQAERFDPGGEYVRRYLPELESVRGKAIFRPWLMEGFGRLDYPAPIVDHDEAVAAFRARRGAT